MTAAMPVAEFAQRVLGVHLWPHQLELVNSPAFITTVAAARRTGKTEAAEVLAMWTAFSHRNAKVLILSAGQDAARRLTESIGARLNENHFTRGAVITDYATRITLTNGSEIISLPASQKQVRGYGKNVLLVVLDEAGFMPNDLWTASHYTVLDERHKGSRLILLGTPWGPADHFFRRAFDAGQRDDPDHGSLHWTFRANPQLDAAYLERQREHVSPAEYAAEIEGRWSDAAGSLFSRELLDSATADIEIPRLDELRGPARGVLGVDWGLSFDRSAAVGLYRLPPVPARRARPGKPAFVALPYVWQQGAPLNAVVDTLVRNLVPFRYLSLEVNGIGAYPSSEVRRRAMDARRRSGSRTSWTWNMLNTTAASKTAAYGLLLGLLEQGQLVLPRHPALLRQLAGLKFEQRTRGFHIAAETDVVKDDVSDALAACCLPYKHPRAHRPVCHLAHLASRSAPADTTAPLLDCAVVTTGGGLEVYARPTLQSVAGLEYTTYAPVTPTRAGRRIGKYFVNTDKEIANAR